MIARAIGELLPIAAAVTLSPIPVIAIVVVLATDRAETNGPAFAVGWVAGLGSLTALLLALGAGSADTAGDTSTPVAWIQVVVGLAFLAAAVRKWRARSPRGGEAEMPAWMASLDTISPARALGFGFALSALNPKNAALTFTAAATITDADLHGAGTVEAALVFVLLGSVTVVGAVLLHLFGGDRATSLLERVKGFMIAHDLAIMLTVMVVLGALLLSEGVAALTA